MNSLREAAAGLSGIFSSTGPSYHKVQADGFEDAETGSGTRPKRHKVSFVPRLGLGRWSTKSVLALVGGIVVMMFLVAAVSRTRAKASLSYSTSPPFPSGFSSFGSPLAFHYAC